MSGRIQAKAARGLQEAVLVSNLRLALPLLQEAGIIAVIEPINPVSVPGYFLNDYVTGEPVFFGIN